MEKRCENCKHWCRYTGSLRYMGSCKELHAQLGLELESRANYVETVEGFCCSLHEFSENSGK